jgi:hypothetical protein
VCGIRHSIWRLTCRRPARRSGVRLFGSAWACQGFVR